MKHSVRRARRKASPRQDGNLFRKNNSEETFFGETAQPVFFKPVQQTVQRKCAECEEEDKQKDGKKMMMAGQKDSKVMEDMKQKQQAVQEDKKKEEDKKLMKKGADAGTSPVVSQSSAIPADSGTTLPQHAQQFFSTRLRYNFSGVKIHTGSEASKKAKNLHAKAYTIGNNIVFNNGEYSTSTYDGKKLLAHELVHVMQQEGGIAKKINRQAAGQEEEEKNLKITTNHGQGPVRTSNTTHYGCDRVSVSGHTDANYSDSFSFDSSGTQAADCEGCSEESCVSNTGTVISEFHANPTVSLPTVPGGLNECETAAVQNFIDTTLTQHEQQHVAAFNTYIGTVRTPFMYHGCADGEEAHAREIHNGLEAPRKTASDAASAALDPFNPTIPCDCPEPEPEPEPAPPETESAAVQAIG